MQKPSFWPNLAHEGPKFSNMAVLAPSGAQPSTLGLNHVPTVCKNSPLQYQTKNTSPGLPASHSSVHAFNYIQSQFWTQNGCFPPSFSQAVMVVWTMWLLRPCQLAIKSTTKQLPSHSRPPALDLYHSKDTKKGHQNEHICT